MGNIDRIRAEQGIENLYNQYVEMPDEEIKGRFQHIREQINQIESAIIVLSKIKDESRIDPEKLQKLVQLGIRMAVIGKTVNNVQLTAILRTIQKTIKLAHEKVIAQSPEQQPVVGREAVEKEREAKAQPAKQSTLEKASNVRQYATPAYNPINQVNKEAWINQHPPECQEAVRALSDAVEHVSFEDFMKSFGRTLDSLKELASKKDFGEYVAGVQEGKSNKWMCDLAKPLLANSKLPTEEVPLVYSTHIKSLLERQANGEKVEFPKNLVLFDDAIYSGEQMSRIINTVVSGVMRQNTELKRLGKPPIPVPKIIIACPYMTKFGEQKLQSLQRQIQLQLRGFSIAILPHETIPTVADKVPTHLKTLQGMYWSKKALAAEKDEGMAMAKMTKSSGAYSTGIMYFDHKTPDALSFPQALAEGNVVNTDGSLLESGIELIKSNKSVYK